MSGFLGALLAGFVAGILVNLLKKAFSWLPKGSAVAGAVTALFGCACPAPHGGIFTFVVVDKPLGYIIALIAGSVAGALMLALLKKKKQTDEV